MSKCKGSIVARRGHEKESDDKLSESMLEFTKLARHVIHNDTQ